MRSLLALLSVTWLSLVACGPSMTLPPAVTCPNVTVNAANGSCDLGGPQGQPCSDGNLYEIDCQDDSTCTCSMNGVPSTSIFVSDQTSGFCATVTASMFNQLSIDCGWNLNPN